MADREQISQVLINLIRNSIDALECREDRKIEIEIIQDTSIRMHQGEIYLSSEPYIKATVKIILPYSSKEQEADVVS